jgi:hypothetical protein
VAFGGQAPAGEGGVVEGEALVDDVAVLAVSHGDGEQVVVDAEAGGGEGLVRPLSGPGAVEGVGEHHPQADAVLGPQVVEGGLDLADGSA